MKKLLSVVLCMTLLFCLGFSSMAQTTEEEVHYITDYENLGQLYEDLEPEYFASLDEEGKAQLYNTSIEEVLAAEPEVENTGNTRATAATFTASLSTSTLLTGRLTYTATGSASVTANSIAVTVVVYDVSTKVVDTDSKTVYNASTAKLSKALTGLTSGAQYKVYATYTAKFPSTVTPSTATDAKAEYVFPK